MNEIENKFLLAGDKIVSEMYLRQPVFRYSACRKFTKNKQRIQKSKETRDSRYICQNEIDEDYFQNDAAYGDFKDLNRKTAFDKILCNKAFGISKNPEYHGYQRGLFSTVYINFLIKNLLCLHGQRPYNQSP